MKNRVEAVLFAAGKKVSEEDLSKLAKVPRDQVHEILRQIRLDYEQRETSLKLLEDNEGWKLSVKEKYIPFVRNIVTETELSKTVMETLGVIAWKYPALQADIIKIRTNKAYDHLDQLEDIGFITRQKFGRTKKIRLTEKFSTYFDLPQNKQAFKNILPEEVKEKVKNAETEIDSHEKIIEHQRIQKDLQNQKQKQIEKYGQAPEVDPTQTVVIDDIEIIDNAKTEVLDDDDVQLTDDTGQFKKLDTFEETPEEQEIEQAIEADQQ